MTREKLKLEDARLKAEQLAHLESNTAQRQPLDFSRVNVSGTTIIIFTFIMFISISINWLAYSKFKEYTVEVQLEKFEDERIEKRLLKLEAEHNIERQNVNHNNKEK